MTTLKSSTASVPSGNCFETALNSIMRGQLSLGRPSMGSLPVQSPRALAKAPHHLNTFGAESAGDCRSNPRTRQRETFAGTAKYGDISATKMSCA